MSAESTGEPRAALRLERELEAVKRFPDGNPNPVLQVDSVGRLLYANPASAPILAALEIDVGDSLPVELAAELLESVRAPARWPVEVDAGERVFTILPVEAPELGFVNLYATDVTAARVLERFPDWNPNPVMRISRDGTLLYANAASFSIMRALQVQIGERLPEEASDALLRALEERGGPHPEIQGDGRHYLLVPVLVPELDTVNVYGTDITALKAIDKFPDENPNPVLRVTRDGRLQYANPASSPLTSALGIEVGDRLPDDFLHRVDAALGEGAEPRIELRADERTFELLVVSVYEFDFINLYGTDVTAAREVERAGRENERLLLAILPPSIADRLRGGETPIADSFEDMSVLFADLVGFTELSARLPPTEVVEILNDVFLAFDELADRHGLEKIKTIGDAYMAVGGLAEDPVERDHAAAVADMALAMVAATNDLTARTGHALQIRVGLHTGPTVAGVIGLRKFIYDVWGDAVNTASRMESHGLPGRIQVTGETHRRLKHRYAFEERGTIDVKGLGRVTTYFLLGPK
jgi:class 3 adenylate cyclase